MNIVSERIISSIPFATYRDLHTLPADQLHGAHYVLLHLHKSGELLGEIWTEGAGVDRLAEGVTCAGLSALPYSSIVHVSYQCCSCQRCGQPWSRTKAAVATGSAMPSGHATGA